MRHIRFSVISYQLSVISSRQKFLRENQNFALFKWANKVKNRRLMALID